MQKILLLPKFVKLLKIKEKLLHGKILILYYSLPGISVKRGLLGDNVVYGFISCGDSDDYADVSVDCDDKTFIWSIIRLIGTTSCPI